MPGFDVIQKRIAKGFSECSRAAITQEAVLCRLATATMACQASWKASDPKLLAQ